MNIKCLFAFALASLMLFQGCDDTVSVNTLDSKYIPSKNVDYETDIQPIFNVKCATSGCHDNSTRKGGLSLVTYGEATADKIVIFPGYPDNSMLVWAIERKSGASPMPPLGYYPLTDKQIQGIITWIKEGAKPKAD